MNGSTETRDYRKRPLCIEAAAALVLSIVAVGLAILGVYSPWGALRFPVNHERDGFNPLVGYALTFVLPMVLGVAAALLGGYAFRKIERSEVKLSGDGFAFFSIMIGLFAAVIGACITFARLVWPVL
jgi:hypothetical protein